MKAIKREKYCALNQLEVNEVAKPVAKENEVLVKVYATTINRTDCSLIAGKPFIIRFFIGFLKPHLPITGTDFAGIIEAVGKKVSTFKVGDRVWGFDDQGLSSHAEYLTIKEDAAIAPIKNNLTYEEAVCGAEGAHYAYNCINKLNIKSGEKILINGATGAIGSAALQISKHLGLYVTAVGNTKNLEMLQALGADKTIDYLSEDFTKNNEKYHYILDAVGKSSFSLCKPIMLPNAIYVSSELGTKNENVYLPLLTKLKGNKRVVFPIPENCRRSVLYINALIEQGAYKAVIDRSYKIEEISEALKYVNAGEKTANVILRICKA